MDARLLAALSAAVLPALLAHFSAILLSFARTRVPPFVVQVDDAVMKLAQDGIVQMDTSTLTAETTLRCLTISAFTHLHRLHLSCLCRSLRLLGRSVTRLESLWNQFFENKNTECPYCPYLEHGDK